MAIITQPTKSIIIIIIIWHSLNMVLVILVNCQYVRLSNVTTYQVWMESIAFSPTNVLMGYNNRQMYIPSHLINVPNNRPTYQGVETSHQQNTTKHTHQGNSKKQPSIQSFICQEAAFKHARNATLRLFQDFTTNDRINEGQLCVSWTKFIVCFNFYLVKNLGSN